MPNPARVNGKNIASQTVSNFNYSPNVNTLKAANDNNVNTKKRPGEESPPTQISTENTEINKPNNSSNIYALKNSDKKERLAREASLGEKTEEEKKASEEARQAAAAISSDLQKLLDNPNVRKTDKKDDKDLEEIERDFNQELLQRELQNNLNIQRQTQQTQAIELLKKEELEKINLVKDRLSKAGIDVGDDEVAEIMNSNFQIKFPYLLFSIAFVIDISTILFSILGIIVAFIPFIGIVMGIVLTGTSFITKISVSIMTFFWSKYYANTSNEIFKKIPVINKIVNRFIMKKIWTTIFGAVLPVPNNIFRVLIIHRFLKKKMHEIEKAVNG